METLHMCENIDKATIIKNYFNFEERPEVIKLFVSFLYENGAYSTFMYNFLTPYKAWITSRTTPVKHNLIVNAFPWVGTPQKYGYWARLSAKWMEKVEETYRKKSLKYGGKV